MIRPCLVFAMALSTAAIAQEDLDPPPEREIRYKDRTVLDFVDSLEVDAALLKPGMPLALERRTAEFNPLIRLREHFDAEMAASVEEVE